MFTVVLHSGDDNACLSRVFCSLLVYMKGNSSLTGINMQAAVEGRKLFLIGLGQIPNMLC